MSLKVYATREDVPSGVVVVECNDIYFNLYTCLSGTKFEGEVLSAIDKAQYRSPRAFIGRFNSLGALDKSMLSTGSKTLLNIEKHPDTCFDVCECGQNALRLLPLLKEGNILLTDPYIVYEGGKECDILYNGKRYTDFYRFIDERLDEGR